MRILYPASSRALPTIAAGLTQLGAQVTQVEAYRTEAAPLDVSECRAWIARGAVGGGDLRQPLARSAELARALGSEDFQRLLSERRAGRDRPDHGARARTRAASTRRCRRVRRRCTASP